MSLFDDITLWHKYRARQSKNLNRVLSLIDEVIERYTLHGSGEAERVNLLPTIADLGYGFKPMAWDGAILGLTYCHPDTGQIVIAPRRRSRLMPDLYNYSVGHELTHALVHRIESGHERYCREDAIHLMFSDWDEMAAHQGAARLLVPVAAVELASESGWTLHETAKALIVPAWLVRVRMQQE